MVRGGKDELSLASLTGGPFVEVVVFCSPLGGVLSHINLSRQYCIRSYLFGNHLSAAAVPSILQSTTL